MRLGGRPADERLARLLRERVDELRPDLLGPDDDDRCGVLAHPPVQLLRDLLHVLLRHLVEAALVARLRPAALVAAAHPALVVGEVGDLNECAVVETVDVAALAVEHRDEGPVPLADERDERREHQLLVEARLVHDRLHQRQRAEEPVEAAGEQRHTPGPGAVELGVEPGANPLEIGLRTLPRLPRQLVAPRLELALDVVEERVHPRLHVPRRRRDGRVEPQIEADRPPALRAEVGEPAQRLPADRGSHDGSLTARGRL